jgi:segregation and condensation protein B
MKVAELMLHIEALLFASDIALSIQDMEQCFLKMGFNNDELNFQEALQLLNNKCNAQDCIYQLKEISGGFQIFTKSDFYNTINTLQNIKLKRQLSMSAIETLSIIAYKQPVSKAEINKIRGVDSSYNIQKLIEKEFITIKGRDNSPSKSILYGTTPLFMEHFGLKNEQDLPKLKEIEITEQNEIGEKPEAFINNN